MLKPKEIQDALDRIADFYPAFQKQYVGNESSMTRSWASILGKVNSKESLMAAVNRYIESGNKYPPSVGEIYQLAKSIKLSPVSEAPMQWPKPHFPDQVQVLVGPIEDEDGGKFWTIELDKKERCVRYQGVYRRKMDFALDVLGGKKVNELTQAWAREAGIWGGVTKSLIGGKFPQEKYKKFLNSLILFCKDVPAGTKVPDYRKIHSLLTHGKTTQYSEMEIPF